jgi:hypothetical protein
VSVKNPNRLTRARLVLAGLGWRVFVRQYRWPLLVLLLAVGLVGSIIAVVALATSGSSSSSTAASVNTYGAALPAVPTNHVTGSGTASVQLRGDTATVTLNTTGLLNGSPHLAHIHGLGLGTCPTASSARSHNGHLSISTGDALRLYGSTLTSFTEWGSTSGSVPSNIDMNRYPANGNIRYRRTMTVTRLVGDLIRDGDAVIVVHGIDYNYNHVYDFGALGVSDLDKTLPGEATAPALCGTLRLSSRTQASADRRATTYVASLKAPVGSSGASANASASSVATTSLSSNGGQSDRISLFCELG